MEYSVKPEVKQREAERGRLSQMEPSVCSISDIDYRITSIPGETLDEGYCLIDAESKGESFPIGLDDPGSISLDVSALASKLAKLEDNGDEQGQKTRTNSSRTLSIGSGKIDGLDFTEVSMEGGGLHKVPVRVEKCGTTIAWEFSTEPKGIAFGIWYKETRESTKEDEVWGRGKVGGTIIRQGKVPKMMKCMGGVNWVWLSRDRTKENELLFEGEGLSGCGHPGRVPRKMGGCMRGRVGVAFQRDYLTSDVSV